MAAQTAVVLRRSDDAAAPDLRAGAVVGAQASSRAAPMKPVMTHRARAPTRSERARVGRRSLERQPSAARLRGMSTPPSVGACAASELLPGARADGAATATADDFSYFRAGADGAGEERLHARDAAVVSPSARRRHRRAAAHTTRRSPSPCPTTATTPKRRLRAGARYLAARDAATRRCDDGARAARACAAACARAWPRPRRRRSTSCAPRICALVPSENAATPPQQVASCRDPSPPSAERSLSRSTASRVDVPQQPRHRRAAAGHCVPSRRARSAPRATRRGRARRRRAAARRVRGGARARTRARSAPPRRRRRARGRTPPARRPEAARAAGLAARDRAVGARAARRAASGRAGRRRVALQLLLPSLLPAFAASAAAAARPLLRRRRARPRASSKRAASAAARDAARRARASRCAPAAAGARARERRAARGDDAAVVARRARALNGTLLAKRLDQVVQAPATKRARFPLTAARLADERASYDGPPLFCASDSVEACRLLRARLRRAPPRRSPCTSRRRRGPRQFAAARHRARWRPLMAARSGSVPHVLPHEPRRARRDDGLGVRDRRAAPRPATRCARRARGAMSAAIAARGAVARGAAGGANFSEVLAAERRGTAELMPWPRLPPSRCRAAQPPRGAC